MSRKSKDVGRTPASNGSANHTALPVAKTAGKQSSSQTALEAPTHINAATRTVETHTKPVAQFTTAPITAGNFSGILPEFGRYPDVQRQFGIRRGVTYQLIRDGLIRSVPLRKRGSRATIRLIDMSSVREYIRACAEEVAS